VFDPTKFEEIEMTDEMRQFDSGATRSNAEGKPDYSGYLSPLAIEGFGRYMLKHQRQADGQYRSSRNWKKGIPMPAYVESLYRHWQAMWKVVDGHMEETPLMVLNPSEVEALREDIYGVMFNIQGFAHEFEKAYPHDVLVFRPDGREILRYPAT
jgi:hypothetical protein